MDGYFSYAAAQQRQMFPGYPTPHHRQIANHQIANRQSTILYNGLCPFK